jgi:hypothetical protein
MAPASMLAATAAAAAAAVSRQKINCMAELLVSANCSPP